MVLLGVWVGVACLMGVVGVRGVDLRVSLGLGSGQRNGIVRSGVMVEVACLMDICQMKLTLG